jgi:hypothetical protein
MSKNFNREAGIDLSALRAETNHLKRKAAYLQNLPRADADRERAATLEINEVMASLSEAEQQRVYNELTHGAFRPDNPLAQMHDTLHAASMLRSDQQVKIAHAWRDTGSMKGFGEETAKRVAELQTEMNRAKVEEYRAQSMEMERSIVAELDEMAANPTLQRLQESALHKVIEAITSGSILVAAYTTAEERKETDKATELVFKALRESEFGVFLIQHNWSGAFERATDFEGGEWNLPYPNSVFEFRLTGRRCCCCILGNDNGEPQFIVLFVETKLGWCLATLYQVIGGIWSEARPGMPSAILTATDKIINIVREQVRAICIALEAEIVETELVRAPHKLNQAREKKGRQPLFDFHTINLAARKKIKPRPLESGDIETEHAHKRLHFVRGHWRHLTNVKTWIKWHMRGDPDLGFIDKEYRL